MVQNREKWQKKRGGLHHETQMRLQIRLINISIQQCQWRCYKSVTGPLKPLWMRMSARAASYLILLLEAVALSALHLGDVLEEVCNADCRVQLTRLVRHINGLPLPQGMSVRLHQAAGVAAHVLALVCGT